MRYSDRDFNKSNSPVILSRREELNYSNLDPYSFLRLERDVVKNWKVDFMSSIYILFLNEEIVYIGRTSYTRYRLKGHDWADRRQNYKQWDSFTVIPVNFDNSISPIDNGRFLSNLENKLISKFQPLYNLAGKN